MLTRNMQTLLNRRGRTVTLSRGGGTYDPDTSGFTPSASSTVSVKCYFADYELSEIDNQSVVMGDRKAILGAKDTSGNTISPPTNKDKITGAEGDVSIESVQKVYNGDTAVVYICQVRGTP